MRRIVLELEYHGKGFVGWQRQGPDRSVQGTVEAAIADLTGHIVSVQSAGRTDRGVHALAMPAHADVETRLAPREIMPALNHRLPHDVSVRRVRNVDPRFHSRFDAVGKLYRYSMLRSRARSPLLGDRVHQVPRELDVAAMRQAAEALVGKHDFASFQTNPDPSTGSGQVSPASDEDLPETTADRFSPSTEPPPWRKPRPKGTVRTISRVGLIDDGELLHLEVEGDGFLRGMVRALAGTLVEVGLRKQTPAWVGGLIDAKDRREAGANLPPHALTLVRVDYPAEPFTGQDSTDDLALI
jgi:tRNA pseudouridine38-40 synthase